MSEQIDLTDYTDSDSEEDSEWVEKRLGEIFESIYSGGTPKKGVDEYYDGDIPFVKIEDLNEQQGGGVTTAENYITEQALEETSTRAFDSGTLLMTIYGSLAETALVQSRVATNQGILGLWDADDDNVLYVRYAIDNSQPKLASLSRQTTQANLGKGIVKKHKIPIPPLPEQRKIATVLYTVDRAIEKTSELIEQLGRVKQGVRQNILTSGITEDGEVRASPESEPEQYTDTRQWTVPNSWELKELSDICSIQVGYAFKSDWYQEEGNVRVLRGANVGYGEPDWSDTYFLEPERVSEYEDYLLNKDDLIIGMDRPYTNSGFKISRLSETDVPSLLVQRVGRFVPEGCDPHYLHVVLSDWRYQKQVLRRAQGMDIPHISQTDILSPKIPLPSLDEQKRIADRYSSILERIDCEENLLREYKTLKQGLIQDLLSGTVRTTDINIEVPEEITQYG